MDRYDFDWKHAPKKWTVKSSNVTGVGVGNTVTFHGTRGGEVRVNSVTPSWGTNCSHDAHVDEVGGERRSDSVTFTITRKVILVCEMDSGNGSWTAEEGG